MEFAAVTTASEVVERGDAEGQRGCCGPAERRPEQQTTARGRREPRRGSTAGPRGSNRQRRPGTAAETVVEQAHEGDGAWKPQARRGPEDRGRARARHGTAMACSSMQRRRGATVVRLRDTCARAVWERTSGAAA